LSSHLIPSQKQAYYACALYGYQDTLLTNIGRQLYAKTYIEGATDFIFGQRSRAWFEKCDIGVVPLLPDSKNNGTIPPHGWITASGRSLDDDGWYVIHKSTVDASAHFTRGAKGKVADGAYFLGRPWRNFARVVFQRTELGRVVNPAGWAIWNVGDERTDEVVYGEFKNKGPGAKGERAAFAVELGEEVAVETVLGDGYEGWVDGKFLK
jgi:pectinesterase